MDRIPTEVLLCILSHLDQRHLAQYAPVCRAFQILLEYKIFAKIIKRIDSVEKIEQFDALFHTIVASPRRRYILRHLQFNIWLPDEFSTKGMKETSVIRDEHFANVISRIFISLGKWDNITRGPDEKRRFRLSIRSVPTKPLGYGAVREYHRHVGFDQFLVLPSLQFVTHFRVQGINILPSTMSIILKALPYIEDLNWDLENPRQIFNRLRISVRESLAWVLLEADFSHLRALTITFLDQERLNYNWCPNNSVGADGIDRLSLAVNRILKLPNLVALDLQGVFILSPTIFSLDEKHENFSESLKLVHVHLSKITPAGLRYFTHKYPIGDFRYYPEPTTFDPFLIAMARGVAKMPALQSFRCCFKCAARISCDAPGQPTSRKSSFSLAEWKIQGRGAGS
ncbi:hypothetical protein F4805DRAFT_410308 [Annulohypoxylon moriforme]|nr:hypothetical protein F4805DRAFT_410308 [Annulohypoxylon moriforme]